MRWTANLLGGLTLIVALEVTSAAALALEPPPGKPPVRNYSMAEYGGDLVNWAVRQAADQRIVVAGGEGLVIFDGANWQAIPTRHHNRIRAMEIDEDGRIWIGSPDEIGYYEPGVDGGLVYHSLIEHLAEDQRTFGDIYSLQLINGAVYFHALRHLFRWQDGDLSVARFSGDVVVVTANHRDRYLVWFGGQLYDYTEFPEYGAMLEPDPDWRLPDGPRPSFLKPWPDGRLLLGTVADGLFWLSDGAPEPVETPIDFSGAWPQRALPMPDGGMLVATRHEGLFVLGPEGEALEQVSHRSGLAVDHIFDMTMDHEKGLWLAKHGAIARVDLFSGRRVYDADFGLSSADALVPFQGHWVIGGQGGLSILTADGHDASRLEIIDATVPQVFDVLDDGDGLLVSGSGGVHRMVPDLVNMGLIEHERLLTDTNAYNLIRSRLRDAIYVDMDSGLGVLMNSEDGWRSLGRIDGVHHRASTVAEDVSGRVWLGTLAGRYYRLAWHDDKLKVEAELTAEHGVPDGYAWAFNLGERMVLGTGQGGYRPIEPDAVGIEPDPDFRNDELGEPRGVYRLFLASGGQVVGGIGPGGTLWRGTLGEDGRFDWQGRWLTDLEPAVNWFIDEHHGYLWIGRHPGLLRLDWPPPEPDLEPSRLQVVRAGFPDQDQWLIAGPGTNGLREVLPASAGSLRFEYALTSHTAPDLTEYRVRLDGLEREWSRWSNEPRRDYTNLPGGDYVFRVQARNAAGLVFESEPLAFRVQPPYYLSPLAWGIYALTAIMLLMMAARLGQRVRERNLLAQKQVLAEQVAERTAEVRAQAREIRQISDARARFFANVSHELRTPLTLTRGPLQELARIGGDRLDDEMKQYLNVALRNSEAMQSLIGQIMDLQRLESRRMPLRLIEVDLPMIVRGIVDRFAVQARLRHIELSCEGADEPLKLVCDQAHIDTMLSNLMSNAIKFTPEGGQVTVRLMCVHGCVELSVTDTGPGIDPSDQQAIFERYRQGEQTSASHPGTGIGLALVRELAELHGGSIGLESQPGKGACFTVTIPTDLQPNATASDPPQAVETPAMATHEQYEPDIDELSSEDIPCVLLVDDNAELRAFLRLRLGRSYRIEEAADGAEGLERARELTPDAIITDGLMPVMDGLAMTREIKSDPELAFVPVLMLTSRASPEDTVHGLESGADDYLSKPFDSAELAARVAGLIASRRRFKARLEHAGSGPAEFSDSPFMAQVNAVLDEHLSDPQFSIRDWAELLHMDRTTLYRRIKGETGQPPEEYLFEKRLQAAARLLTEGTGNVAEVADAVGFASVSHFSRRFKQRFDTTPAAFGRLG
jgi:signal transduction histidine kinase/DNA-binding response OmpR family regulator/ligand-binding sensor domain-containing protein